jgi:FMN-dependent NADH-azoreductase
MKKMLAIHSSPRGERSHSRRLAEVFLAAWHAANPDAHLSRREVGRASIPHVSEAFIAASFHPEPQSMPLSMHADLQLSNELVAELVEHELLVISVPMYNFGIPSGLKAWIDQIVRMGHTVDITQDSQGIAHYQPLLLGKKALIITSRGGENEAMNHADPHLRTALGFIGIEDVTVIAAEGEESDPSVFRRSCDAVEGQLRDLAGSF